MRASERNPSAPPLAMDCQLTVAFVSPCVLASIDPAPLLDQPRPECCDFHRSLLSLTSAINRDSLRAAKFRVQ
jgi:hypothetical protein